MGVGRPRPVLRLGTESLQPVASPPASYSVLFKIRHTFKKTFYISASQIFTFYKFNFILSNISSKILVF